MGDSDFFDVADEFIQLANELGKRWPTTRISAAIMYASARYNAFNFFATDSGPKTKKDAVEYYRDQYQKMLEDNMEELGATNSDR